MITIAAMMHKQTNIRIVGGGKRRPLGVGHDHFPLPNADARDRPPATPSEVGRPFQFGRGNDSEDVDLFVS
jgi:hypothetical protein